MSKIEVGDTIRMKEWKEDKRTWKVVAVETFVSIEDPYTKSGYHWLPLSKMELVCKDSLAVVPVDAPSNEEKP